MKIKKVNLGIFASSPSLMGRIQTLGEHRHIRFQFDTHGLDDAIPIAAEMERRGIEVALGRRGTAHLSARTCGFRCSPFRTVPWISSSV